MQPSFSTGARRLLSDAHQAAGRYRHRFIHTEYLLLGLLQERNSATELLKKLGFDREQLRKVCQRHCQRGSQRMEENMKFTPRSQAILSLATEQARALGDNKVDSSHLLLGILMEPQGLAGQILRAEGITEEAARAALVGEESEAVSAAPFQSVRHPEHPLGPERPWSLWKILSRT